jgi:hypothetical protein
MTATLKERALVEHEALRLKNEQYYAERAERERTEIVAGCASFVRTQLQLDGPFSFVIEGSMVYFEAEGLPLGYNTSHADYRYREQLYLGLTCPAAATSDPAVHHDLIYERFDGLADLGNLLSQPLIGKQPCWACQVRDEERADSLRAATLIPRAPTPLERIGEALDELVRQAVADYYAQE